MVSSMEGRAGYPRAGCRLAFVRGALSLDRERTTHTVVCVCVVVAAAALAMLGVRGLLSIASVHSSMNSAGAKEPRSALQGPLPDVSPSRDPAPTPR
jgi:hypothetical protein